MKKLFIIIGFVFFFLSCKKSTEVSDETVLLSEVHPLDKPYDTKANVLHGVKYMFVLDLIAEFGPMSIRKENGKWFVYKFNDSFMYTGTRFKLFRIPLDYIYNKKNKIVEKYFYVDPLGNKKNSFLIDFTNTLDNVLSAEGINYNSINNDYEEIRRTNEFKIQNFGFEINDNDSTNSINGSAIAFNTTNNNIKNFKLKISVFDDIIDGKLITEDIVLVKDTLKTGQSKIIEIHYKPKNKVIINPFTPSNIEIIDFEKF